jgi:hypothetical protein
MAKRKVESRPKFLVCRCRVTYCWKALKKGYNFALDLISIRGMHTKLCVPKVMGDLTLGILGLRLGSLRTKCHLDVGPLAKHRVYYKGRRWWLPPSPISEFQHTLLPQSVASQGVCPNSLLFYCF